MQPVWGCVVSFSLLMGFDVTAAKNARRPPVCNPDWWGGVVKHNRIRWQGVPANPVVLYPPGGEELLAVSVADGEAGAVMGGAF